MQMMGMLNGKASPVQMVNNLMTQQFQNHPMWKRAQEMAQGKSPEQVEQVIKNLCQQRGINFDDALKQFQSQFPGMK